MFEIGDVVLLPPEYSSEKKGVLARREADGCWLVQIGTAGYKFVPEKELQPISGSTKCWRCGARLNPGSGEGETCGCPVCGALDRRRNNTKAPVSS